MAHQGTQLLDSAICCVRLPVQVIPLPIQLSVKAFERTFINNVPGTWVLATFLDTWTEFWAPGVAG